MAATEGTWIGDRTSNASVGEALIEAEVEGFWSGKGQGALIEQES